MNLELKAIKHSGFASQETHCYEAALYLDGKPLAIVSNDGRGGCDSEHKHPKYKGDEWRAEMQTVHDHFKAMPTKHIVLDGGYEFDHQPDLEGWCCDQVNAFLTTKDLKKKLNKKIVMLDESDGKIYEVNSKYNPAQLDKIKAKWPGHIILNSMPFDEALKLFNLAK